MPTSLGCAYLGQYHLGQFRRDLEAIVPGGFMRLYLPLSEEDMALRRPNLEAMCSLAREAGLEVWMIPWGVGGVFSGPRGTAFVARHLDARQIDSMGESLPAACPNNPRFTHFMETWIQAAHETGAAGVLLDEPVWLRHPTLPDYRAMDTAHLWTCRCEHCQRRFLSLYRAGEMPEEMDDDVRDFRARSMGAFLSEIGESAWRRKMASELRVSRHGFITTWEIVARQSWCRRISLSAFWPLPGQIAPADWDFGPSAESSETHDARIAEFERQLEAGWGLLERLHEFSQARRSFWLRCFQVPEADEPMIATTIEKLAALGAEDFSVWSFGGTATLGQLACERPAEAWQATVEALKE